MRTSTSWSPLRGLFLLTLCLVPATAFGFGKKPVAPPPITPPPVTPPLSGTIPNPTQGSDFLSCFDKIGGSWSFLSAPSGCNVSPAQSAPYAKAQYAPVIFQDGGSSAAKLNTMTELFSVAREVGTYYLKRRNPNASASELAGFLHGFYTLLHQESFWTHYRIASDGKLRYMRGDVLHGFGIMQVDDRSHSVALNQGKGVDLIENMIYGLDIYYAAWVRSASASCVSSASNYQQRARAAWSAYNGGPSRLCRWADPSATSHAKDVAYFEKFQAQSWLSLVSSQQKPSRLNVACLAEGARPCVNF